MSRSLSRLSSGSSRIALYGALCLTLFSCTKAKEEPPRPLAGPPPAPTASAAVPAGEALRTRALSIFGGPLPARADANDPATEAQIALGRMLYHDARLSRGQDISCSSCHSLPDYGIDVRQAEGMRQVSLGHKGQRGGRNTPTVYNAGLHFRQFWDGRAADLKDQAKGPVLNPVEMAMTDENAVLTVLRSIPGYVEAFRKAFPDEAEPLTYDNVARAIAAFEAGLVTPDRFDAFLAGKADALSEQEQRGLGAFIDSGCIACHMGSTLGGTMYQKLGLLKPYDTKDFGRHQATSVEADRFFFKVPSLRNVAMTPPYLHDGSIDT
ncbi:MAG TPA: cytochrome c peroxidase, partial [Haliangium sp.]|nr:cytochrome c peroxidase [Haliangium sp.]